MLARPPIHTLPGPNVRVELPDDNGQRVAPLAFTEEALSREELERVEGLWAVRKLVFHEGETGGIPRFERY